MSAWTRLRRLWRHQPVIRMLVLFSVLVQGLQAGLDWVLWRAQITWMRALHIWWGQGQEALPAAPPMLPQGQALRVSPLNTLFWMLHIVSLAWLLWAVRVAYAHSEKPLSWRQALHPFLAPVVRLFLAYLVGLTVGSVVFMPVFLLGVGLGVTGGWVPVLCLGVLVVLALWWVWPWWGTFLVAAVVEHPAGPGRTWKAYRAAMRRADTVFRPLATGMWLTNLVVWSVVAWSALRAWSTSGEPLAWLHVWPAAQTAALLMVLDLGGHLVRLTLYGVWVVAYLDARPAPRGGNP